MRQLRMNEVRTSNSRAITSDFSAAICSIRLSADARHNDRRAGNFLQLGGVFSVKFAGEL
jgi:hypothetical protein